MRVIHMLFIFGFVFCQTTIEGIPKSFTNSTQNRVEKTIMPAVNVDQLLIEDSNALPGTPFRYGKIFDVDFSLNNSGTWETLEDGSKIWRLEIQSKYAYSIGIEYDYFNLPPGSEFYVYNLNKTIIHGAYSAINNQSDYLFSTPLLKGDTIILEYYEPENAEFEGEIYLSEIIHDYRDIMNLYEGEQNDNDRICATNTHGNGELCSGVEPYEMVINATSWLDMGGFICSGSMINNTSYDLSKYYMTAWHCTNGENPSTFRFYFNYGAYSCASDNGSAGISLYGAQQLATSNSIDDSDWTLLKITGGNVPDDVWNSWEIFYAGWNRSTENSVVSCAIHHPGGSPKRINFDDDIAYSASWNQGNPNTHWRVFWDNGGTQGGSSGCPLYDENFRLIGVLTGGPDLPCGDDGSYDLYGKFDRAWNDVKEWLDPDDTGAMFVDGTYDGSLIIQGCTDPDAENYNSDANMDDGSCFYGLADIYFGNTSYESLGIMSFNSAEIAQFEFKVSDNLNLITLSNAYGGIAEENDFIVSVSPDGQVIGTSISGSTIPIGEGLLTNLNFTFNNSGTTEVCISDHIFKDINGNEILVPGDSCSSIELTSNSTMHTVEAGTFYYSPSTLIINTGDTVIWDNISGFHDVVAYDGSFSLDACSSPCTIGEITFNEPGEYNYFCSVGNHEQQGMVGTVIVEDSELAIDDSMIDLEFGISNIYPNPFNPLVNFDIQLLETENININIYDLRGNKIDNIYNGILGFGNHTFSWDANNFPTGIYIISCNSNNLVSNQKVLLMK